MNARRAAASLLPLSLLTALLSGCSIEAIVWRAEGAEVIETTGQLVRDLSETGDSPLVCDGAQPRLGEAGLWEARLAGEPEEFHAPYWPDQVKLDPHWNINIEQLPPGIETGEEFPSDVFYRRVDDGLCVVDVAWATLAG